MQKQQMKLGVAWYCEDQWELLKSTASDPEAIEDTYQEWLESVGQAMKNLKKNGLELVKVDFDVNKFSDWCLNNNRVPNGESRAEYAAHLLRTGNEDGSDRRSASRQRKSWKAKFLNANCN